MTQPVPGASQLVSLGDIVVTGHRIIDNPIHNYFNSLSFWLPQSFTAYDFNRSSGPSLPIERDIVLGPTVFFKVPGLNLNVSIPYADWHKLNASQQYAISETLQRWDFKDTPFKHAIERISQAGASISIRVGNDWQDAHGNVYDWTFPYGDSPPIANVGWLGNRDGQGDTVRPNDQIVINFNENRVDQLKVHTFEPFANAFIHEILHTYFPDMYVNDEGEPDDHPLVYPAAANTVRDLFEGRPQPSGGHYEQGSAKMGSYNSEAIFGSNESDFIAGGGGDDYLDGGLGSNALFGGPGADRLVSHGDSDFLSGGEGSDTYVLAAPGSRILETSGTDTIIFDGQASDYTFQRMDNDLIVGYKPTGTPVTWINEHYTSSDFKVDYFAFLDVTLGSFAVEDLAAGGNGSGGGSGPPNPWEYPAAGEILSEFDQTLELVNDGDRHMLDYGRFNLSGSRDILDQYTGFNEVIPLANAHADFREQYEPSTIYADAHSQLLQDYMLV